MAGPYSSMGDGHLVYNNEISYLIGTVNTRESRSGKGNVQIELQSRSPVLTRHCALQEPRGGAGGGEYPMNRCPWVGKALWAWWKPLISFMYHVCGGCGDESCGCGGLGALG